MITKEKISEAFVRLAKATNRVQGSAILLNAGADLRDYAEELLKERDNLLEENANLGIDAARNYDNQCGVFERLIVELKNELIDERMANIELHQRILSLEKRNKILEASKKKK